MQFEAAFFATGLVKAGFLSDLRVAVDSVIWRTQHLMAVSATSWDDRRGDQRGYSIPSLRRDRDSLRRFAQGSMHNPCDFDLIQGLHRLT